MPLSPQKRRAKERLSRWNRSKKGNLWRRLADGTNLSTFHRWWDETYGFAIHQDGETRFSEFGYETELEAAESAIREVDDEQ